MKRASHGVRQARTVDELVEAHEVRLVRKRKDGLAKVRVGHALVEQRHERRHRSAHDAPGRHSKLGERLCEERDHLRLGRGPLRTIELNAKLGKLARLPLEGGPLTHDGGAVAQPHWTVSEAHARRDEARDGKRQVRTDHE